MSPFKNFVRFLALVAIVLLTGFFSACNDEESSPFGDVLTSPPYSTLTDSIRKQPNNDVLYFRRAVLLNKNNLPEPALADFKKAWSLSKHEEYAFGITNVWIEKKPDSAVLFLEGALKELPQSYLLRISLARAYDKLGKTEEAIKVCRQILEAMPDQPDTWLLQSELLEKKGDTTGSIAALEKTWRLVPSFNLGQRLAYKYAENKDPKALALCDTLIRIDTQKLFVEPYYIKGIYYSNINDKAKAISFFDETIKLSYNYLNAYIEKGKILLDQKKTADAYKVFQLANTIKPSFPDAYYWMGVCQETMGQKEDARLNYEKAYGLDKSFTEAKEAADKLSKTRL